MYCVRSNYIFYLKLVCLLTKFFFAIANIQTVNRTLYSILIGMFGVHNYLLLLYKTVIVPEKKQKLFNRPQTTEFYDASAEITCQIITSE